MRAGKSEKQVQRDVVTGLEIWRMTNSPQASFHSYYDLCPWSPAGDKVLFAAMDVGAPGSDIYWMDASDGTLHAIGRSSVNDPHKGALQQWLDAGQKLAYADHDDAGPCVRVVDLESQERLRLPGQVRMVQPGGRRYAWHTDEQDEPAIMRKDEAGLFLTDIGGASGGSGGASGGGGRRVASIAEVLALNPRAREVAGWHLYIKHTKWSPSGERLFFVVTNELYQQAHAEQPRVKDLYVIDADGSNLRWLTSFTWGHHPSWHPDGRRILLNDRTSPGQPCTFVLVNADTGGREQVTDVIQGSGHPTFSPDGRRLLVERVTGSPGEARLLCVNLDRHVAAELARFTVKDHSHQGTHVHPVWSRDGRFILYNSDQTGRAELYMIPVAGQIE